MRILEGVSTVIQLGGLIARLAKLVSSLLCPASPAVASPRMLTLSSYDAAPQARTVRHVEPLEAIQQPSLSPCALAPPHPLTHSNADAMPTSSCQLVLFVV